jgi:hypothetical protein
MVEKVELTYHMESTDVVLMIAKRCPNRFSIGDLRVKGSILIRPMAVGPRDHEYLIRAGCFY